MNWVPRPKPTTLGEKQREFTLMVSFLIGHAYEEGYELTFGDVFRDQRVTYGHPNSLHRQRLAVDLNLFKDGKYLRATSQHEPLGIFWESIGGTWGGRFDDGNHYSIEHGGMK
jgi:hypothetical protein